MKIIYLILLLLTIQLICGLKTQRKVKSKWFFDSWFKWTRAYFKFQVDNAVLEYKSEINSSDRGLFLTKQQLDPKIAAFFAKFTNQINVDNKDTLILDFELMPNCEFQEIEKGFFSGQAFYFSLREFGTDKRYRIEIAFKWGAKVLGSKSPNDIMVELRKNCLKRHEAIKKEKEAQKKEEEKRRIEAEQLAKVEAELLMKKQNEEKEALKKKIAEEQALKKKIAAEEELKKKLSQEELLRAQKQKEEEERKRKEQEDLENKRKLKEIEDEARRAQEEAKKRAEEELIKLEAERINKKEEEVKLNTEEEKKLLSISNLLRVKYNCGFGNALYITGEGEGLGNWKTGHKLDPVSGASWHYKSASMISGNPFKLVISKWVNGKTIQLPKGDKNLKWEGKVGPAGNKIFNFIDYVMDFTPNFNHRRMRRNK